MNLYTKLGLKLCTAVVKHIFLFGDSVKTFLNIICTLCICFDGTCSYILYTGNNNIILAIYKCMSASACSCFVIYIYFTVGVLTYYIGQRVNVYRYTLIVKNVTAIQFQILFIKLNLENTIHITRHVLYNIFCMPINYLCVRVCGYSSWQTIFLFNHTAKIRVIRKITARTTIV